MLVWAMELMILTKLKPKPVMVTTAITTPTQAQQVAIMRILLAAS